MPIVGATITLNHQISVQTDGNGVYSFTGVQWPSTGAATVWVQKQATLVSIRPVNIGAPFPTTLNESLLPGGIILQGTVTDTSTNQPIANAVVYFYADNPITFVTRYPYDALNGQTDLSGHYAVDSSQFLEAANTAAAITGSMSVTAANYIDPNLTVSVNISTPVYAKLQLNLGQQCSVARDDHGSEYRLADRRGDDHIEPSD